MIYETPDIGETVKWFIDELGMVTDDHLEHVLEDGRIVLFKLDRVFPNKAEFEAWRRSLLPTGDRMREQVIDNLEKRGLMNDDSD